MWICTNKCVRVYFNINLRVRSTKSRGRSWRFYLFQFFCIIFQCLRCCRCCSACVATKPNSSVISDFLTIEIRLGHNYYTFNVSFLFACLSIYYCYCFGLFCFSFSLFAACERVCVCVGSKMLRGAIGCYCYCLLFMPACVIPFCRAKFIYMLWHTVSFNAPANFLNNNSI